MERLFKTLFKIIISANLWKITGIDIFQNKSIC